jgi:DUF1680 family protein
MDVFERAAYNGFLSGVSLSGDRFFYPNPLAYDGKARSNHGHAGRAPWFGCAWCPPNVLRTLAAFTDYFYAVSDGSLYVNVYAESEATLQIGASTLGISQRTDYPWHGLIRLMLSLDAPASFTLRLRIPGWARGEPVPSDLYRDEESPGAGFALRVNGATTLAPLSEGYLVIERSWQPGDVVELELGMPVRRARAHQRIAGKTAQVAFERGPLVYCLEQLDAQLPLAELQISPQAGVAPVERPELLGGVTTLRVEAAGMTPFECVPYYAWNNRGLGALRVWLPLAT